ncbi:LysM peptidoglycan-binding domain-containing protein [Robertmurraya kyonggiensis]|uniref:LysM peptidoglycan-binding domain-containing protein n=1 Tax=Robertmurraya kyonggiensis TaxID=1037680 RepID=A0A4V5P2X5_9BACI|nr:LysM peptidoglycan-binding domain-containing protein [Robertmurraya kyonggiensis]
MDSIKEANGLLTGSTRLGQTLIIPQTIIGELTNTLSDTPPSTQQTTKNTVVSGDSLSVIAKRFGTTVESLKTVNNFNSDLITIGQTLLARQEIRKKQHKHRFLNRKQLLMKELLLLIQFVPGTAFL